MRSAQPKPTPATQLACRAQIGGAHRRAHAVQHAVATVLLSLLTFSATLSRLRVPPICRLHAPPIMASGVGGIAHVRGSASTSEELTACKIGGCCGKDTPLLAHDALLARLPALPMWRLSPDRTAISKEFVAKNWAAAMAFFNAVSVIAEDEGHHPDLHLTGWRNVRVELSTHAIGGLSLPDLVLAAKIDAIPTEYSPKWLREQQKLKQQGSK